MTQQGWATTGRQFVERADPRYQLSVRASLTTSEGREFNLQMRDISVGGFAGRALDALPPGSRVTLILPDVGAVASEILWQIGPTMGGRFVEKLPADALDALAADQSGSQI